MITKVFLKLNNLFPAEKFPHPFNKPKKGIQNLNYSDYEFEKAQQAFAHHDRFFKEHLKNSAALGNLQLRAHSAIEQASEQTSKQAIEQESKQAIEQASEQTSKQAIEQESKQAIEQASEQASERVALSPKSE